MARVDNPIPSEIPPEASADAEAEIAWRELAVERNKSEVLEARNRELEETLRLLYSRSPSIHPKAKPPIESLHTIESTVKKQPTKRFDVATKAIAAVLIVVLDRVADVVIGHLSHLGH